MVDHIYEGTSPFDDSKVDPSDQLPVKLWLLQMKLEEVDVPVYGVMVLDAEYEAVSYGEFFRGETFKPSLLTSSITQRVQEIGIGVILGQNVPFDEDTQLMIDLLCKDRVLVIDYLIVSSDETFSLVESGELHRDA
tara:strand:+ start:219179 stop:219586 length:408 start_codon:yes stop_codon:yes gene_type:complete